MAACAQQPGAVSGVDPFRGVRVSREGRVPGGAGGEARGLEEHDVGPAGLREVVQDAGADDAPTDDDDLSNDFTRPPQDSGWEAYARRATAASGGDQAGSGHPTGLGEAGVNSRESDASDVGERRDNTRRRR